MKRIFRLVSATLLLALTATPTLTASGNVVHFPIHLERWGSALEDPAVGTITASDLILGQTTHYIGATEAGGFWISDLNGLGINTYRLWTKMSELEWWDDDDAMDGLWDDSEYGSPTIAEIKADAVNNFANTVPWSWWDARFSEAQTWRYGTQSRQGIIEALVQNDITPIVMLRTYDDQGSPEMRPSAQWAPRPPVTTAFRNEWWEHCFAIAYWLNVRNDYGVTHFEVLNEPDYPGQGWQEYGGTQADYVQLVQDAYDALSYANGLAGLPVFLHAPVVAASNSPYVAYTLDNADPSVQVVDYHTYANDPRSTITGISSTIENHNPDGIIEPVWVSEWGALWVSYDSFDRAMLTANQLLTFSEEQVEGVTIFNMYDWSTAAGQDYGLVDLTADGSGGANRNYTESFYAFRLMTRGLVGGKDQLAKTSSGFLGDTRTMVTRDADYIYVIVLRNNVGQSQTVNVDLRAFGHGTGAASVWEYSAANSDFLVETPEMSDGQFSFTTPANGISLARVAIASLNSAPTTTGIPDVTVGEDAPNTVIDLWPSFADAEDADSALTYTVTGNTNPPLFTSVEVTGVPNRYLELDYAPNHPGAANLTIRATDSGGLWVETTFAVTVEDTTPPVVTVPGVMTVEASGPEGAAVSYTPAPTALDNVDGPLIPVCSPVSGSTFAIGGPHLVTCSATDMAGNTGYGYFTVTVQDTTPPVVTVPGDITEHAASPAGAVVNYVASASDAVGVESFDCVPPSGSLFNLGRTPVTCIAADAAGNTGYGYFNVSVLMSEVGLSATSHDFGYQEVGTISGAFTVTVTNTGDGNLILGTLHTDGEFALSGDGCSGQTVVPAGNCAFGVTFSPLSAGEKSGHAYIPSNAATSEDVVALGGNGYVVSSANFTSIAAQDGYVTERKSTEMGGSASARSKYIQIGDASGDRQMKGFLSFDTSTLPAGAVIVGAHIELHYLGSKGNNNPFDWSGPLLVDIASPFGTSALLEKSDFEAAALATDVAVCDAAPDASNGYTCDVFAGAGSFNLSAFTQFRLYFGVSDNGDKKADYVRFASANSRNVAYYPVLVVEYYVP